MTTQMESHQMSSNEKTHRSSPPDNTQLANAAARALYLEFQQTIKLLESCGNNRVLKMWEEDLHELHDKAQHLLAFDCISEPNQIYLKIITSRTVDDWIIISRDKNKSYYSY